jgi:hypothetical protein
VRTEFSHSESTIGREKTGRLGATPSDAAICVRHGHIRPLTTLSDADLARAESLNNGLFGRTASIRSYPSGREARIAIGPTGAANILFALRPDALVPWDAPMRSASRLDGSGRSYRNCQWGIQLRLESLAEQCGRHGFSLTELPSRMGRPESSCPKLIDEFYWVTVTRKWPLPNEVTFRTWAGWL